MTGEDGRIYDRHFDYDNDGKLNAFEGAMYDDSFGECESSGRVRGTVGDACIGILAILLKLLAIVMMIFGVILLVAVPPLGALLITGAKSLMGE